MKRAIKITILLSFFAVVFSYTPATQQVFAKTEQTKTVQLGGEPFGIRMFSEGVLVIEVDENLYGRDVPSPALLAGIQVNDVIKLYDGVVIESNEQFTEIIKNSNGNELTLTIERDGKIIETKLTPEYDAQGNLRAGLWIKDSAAGIGTVTYYDDQTFSFGALGHGICESQTGKLLPISYGEIAKANINDVTKSENGHVGSLNGYFEGDVIGYAYTNCECGVFGVYSTETENEILEVADKNEVKIGDAEIYCTVNGNQKESYDIKIKRLSHNGEDTMLIEITDPQLLEITGGIVQGMSGSPIVQNGKLVGAVTHVLVNNVKCGYGIYIEDMINSQS